MLPMMLDNVAFRSENRFQPVIEALEYIHRHVNEKGRKHRYFKEKVPIDGVVPPSWASKVFEEVDGETKVNRHYYELCVLQKLQRALKCKEVWVEGYPFSPVLTSRCSSGSAGNSTRSSRSRR